MTATDNLWPEFNLDEVIRSPKTILNEQAEFLAKKTKNLLMANVKTYVGNNKIRHDFEIIAPKLNGYKYTLFNITHESVFIYPCIIDLPMIEYKVENESILIEKLKDIFNSSEIKKVIQALISQSIEDYSDLPF